MDDICEGAQPHCPEDDIVMRNVPGGWECPECGHVQEARDVQMLPAFDGTDVHYR